MADVRMAPFGADDEATLRRFASGSTALGEEAIARLMQLKLATRHGHGYRLTPLGKRKFRSLSKPVLHQPDRGDPIASVLDKYAASFQAAHEVAPPRIETRGRPTRQMAEEGAMSPVVFFDTQRSLMEARLRILKLRERMRRQRAEDRSRAASSALCLTQSLASLAASARLLHDSLTDTSLPQKVTVSGGTIGTAGSFSSSSATTPSSVDG